MSDNNRTGIRFIKEDTSLPRTLSIETEAFLPGWRTVKNIDPYAMARKIEAANWNFFYLAGGIRATVFGRDTPGTLRRAVKRVLAKQKGQKFNSLQITKCVSKHFLGIPFMSITVHSRHIQEGIGLVPATSFVLRESIATVPTIGLDTGEPQHHGEVVTNQCAALISNS